MTMQERLPLGADADTHMHDEWRLDDRTREIGRRGLADARAALVEAARRAEERDAERRLAHAA